MISFGAKEFNYDEVQFFYIFLLSFVPLMSIDEDFDYNKDTKIYYIFFQNFIVLGLKFKSMFHFELIFVYCIRSSTSTICVWISSFPNTIFQDYSLPIKLSWHTCQNQFTIYVKVYFWLSILFHLSICLPLYQHHIVLTTVSSYQILKLGSVSTSPLFLFRILAILGSLIFNKSFRIILSISLKEKSGILIDIALNL